MNTQIYQEASAWLIEFRLDEPDRSARRRFESWLGNSPEHVRAYLELIAAWEDSSRLDAQGAIDVDALIKLSRAEATLVEWVGETGAMSLPAKGKWGAGRVRRSRLFAAAAMVVMVLGSCCGWWYWAAYQRGTYVTDIAQQSTLALPDGTLVELNADTRIRERYTVDRRTVELIRGQALFRVARHPGRPFFVVTDTAAVRAVGTQFDVYRKSTGTTVTVIEGKVAVSPSAQANVSMPQPEGLLPSATSRPRYPSAVLLSAGEQIRVTKTSSQRTAANILAATGWTQQKLIFQAAPLAEVAAEFNRFNSRKLIVNPKGLEEFRINGTFPAADPNSLSRFLSFLRDQPGIALEEDGARVLVTKNR